MNEKLKKEIATIKQTPAYIFDIDKMKEGLDWIRNSLKGRAKICYAMKANPLLISEMVTGVDKLEVCSPGEFRICERHHIPMEHIVLSGVYKEQKDIERILETYKGVGKYTVESWTQLELLESCARAKNLKIDVLIRVTSGNQFGLDEVDVCRIIQQRSQFPSLYIRGLQYYSGTQKKKLEKIEQELQYLDQLYQKIAEIYQFNMEELEYGPGFFVSYFENENEKEEDRDSNMKRFVKLLDSLAFQGEIILEMGRFMVADCGFYCSKIVDQKTNKGQNYCIIDGGINHVNYYGQTMAMKVPKHIHIAQHRDMKKEDNEPTSWNICGSLCTVGDVLVKNMPLCNPKLGDLLVFENVGAYSITEGIYLFLSRNLPSVFFYSREKGLQLVREESVTDTINSISKE